MASDDDRGTFEELERRLRTLLPEDYRDTYEDVQPVSMGSAALVYGADGQVAWNAMWGSFCDLAMAGGPPHKGLLLEPAARDAIAADPEGYAAAVSEICRGVEMVTGLPVEASAEPGWVAVTCDSRTMAAWLLRAITMENVAVRADATVLYLPAGPAYRVVKEIKNVITAVAKTTHYWLEHMSTEEWAEVRALLDGMDAESPLVEPVYGLSAGEAAACHRLAGVIADRIRQRTGLASSPQRSIGWLAVECGSVHSAVWMMRMLATTNVLSRREQTALLVPVNPVSDPAGDTVTDAVELVHRLAALLPTS
jgi:hypothetical protein